MDGAVDSHANNDEASHVGDDTESVDSNRTQEVGTEGLLRRAEDYRERKITLGGQPTRPIAEYSKELEQSRLVLMPEPAGPRSNKWRTPDEEYYHHYCLMESSHFHQEFMSWQSFVRWFRRTWAEQNGAAGVSLPTPPPILEMEPLDLHTQYLGFILLCRKEDEKENSDLRSWNFDTYEDFLEHIAAVEKQVARMRAQRALEENDRFRERLGYCARVLADGGLGSLSGLQEQLQIVADELAEMRARRARKHQSSGDSPLAEFLQQPAAGPEPEPQLKGTKRKRKHEEEVSGPGLNIGSPGVNLQDGMFSTPKRTKRGGFKVELKHGITEKRSAKKPRSKIIAKTQDDGAGHSISGPKQAAVEAKREVKSHQKRRARPTKQSRSDPILDKIAQDKTKSGQRRRGGPRDKDELLAQESHVSITASGRRGAKKKATAATVQSKVASVSGHRRSVRIAEKAKKGIS